MTQRTVGADDVTGEFDGVVETRLQTLIDDKVQVETDRATGVENDLQSDLSDEVTRATDAESDLSDDIATETANRIAQDLLLIPLTQKGAAGGVATLDGGTKIPLSQLPSSVFIYRGLWNAATNTPTLADGTGSAGDTYRVSVGGTRNLGSGPILFAVGDLVIYDGSVWQKSDSAESVTSVNSKTGTVVLDKTDIGLSNVDNTSDANKPVSTAQAASIAVVQADIDAHEADTANPHSVTKAQVGLGNADNTSDVNKPVSTAQAAADSAATAAAQATSAQRASNLSDLANAGTARTNLGLGNVDNTSDANKPVSTAAQTALNLKADLASPTFTGDPKAPTASPGDNDTSIATTAFVTAADTALGATKQPLDQDLTDIAALTSSNDDLMQRKAGAWTNRTPAQVKTDLALVKGDVGLGNVDNTSDANKPVSTAQQAALDLKINNALVDAKGDIVTATANDTPSRKAVGANGATLVADSTQTDGLRWTTALRLEGSGEPEGSVTAVVGSVYTDTTNGFLYEKQTGTGNTGWVGVGQPLPRFAFAAGSYFFPLASLGPGTIASSNNSLRLHPWFCPQPFSIAKVGAEITTVGESGSKVRLGIYADSGGVPGSLILDAGQIAGDSLTVQDITLGSPTLLSRGWYWLGGVVQSAPTTQPICRGITGSSSNGFLIPAVTGTSIPGANSQAGGYFQNSVSGGLPNPFVSGGQIASAVRLHFKLS